MAGGVPAATPAAVADWPIDVGYGLLEAAFIDWHVGGFASPADVLKMLVEAAERIMVEHPDPRTFGTGERARRGMAAAEAAVGGPARPRPPRPVEEPGTP